MASLRRDELDADPELVALDTGSEAPERVLEAGVYQVALVAIPTVTARAAGT